MADVSDQELDRIHQDLQDDGLYVHPGLADQLTAAQLDQLTSNIAAAPGDAYVVVYPFSAGDEYSGSAADLLTRLHDRHPEPGVYLSTTTDLAPTDYSGIRLEGRQWGVPGQEDGDLASHELLFTVTMEDPPTVGDALVRATELLGAGPEELDQAYDAAYEAEQERAGDATSTGSGVDGGDGSGGDGLDPTGLLGAGVLVAVVGAAGWAALRRARGPRSATRPQPLPPSAMARIRQAHDRRLEERARDDVLALGERIDATEIGSGHDRDAWQAAIDHYDAARRVLDRPGRDVLDVVGAIVLAGRGRDALAAAQRGRAWEPEATCFLNPLHGAAAGERTVEHDGRRIEAPLCKECRTALTKDRIPDILDVERDGRPLHYFETDDEPWSSSGYGALHPDLLERLHRSR